MKPSCFARKAWALRKASAQINSSLLLAAAATGAMGAGGRAMAETSLISAPVFVSMEALRGALEKSVPTSGSGSQPAKIGGAVSDDTFSWNFKREPMALSGAEGWLDTSTSASGVARVKGKARIIRGDLGRLLGKLNPTTVPFSASADIAADLRLRARPLLKENWRLDAEIQPSVRIREARIPILNITSLSVRGKLQDAIDPELRQLAAQLRQSLADDPFLENAARKAWDDLCRAHRVSVPADGAAGTPTDLWIIVRPVAFHAAQPVIDAAGLTIHLGVEAETWISGREEVLDCTPMPALSIGTAEPGVALQVPVQLDYATLSQTAGRIVGQTIDVGNGSLAVIPRDVRISGADGAVTVEIDADLRPDGFFGWLFGPTEGWVRLTSTPVLDAKKQEISFSQSRIEARSKDFDSLTRAIADLAQGQLVETFERNARFDLAKTAADAQAEVEQAAASLRAEGLGDAVVADASINELRLKSLVTNADGLIIVGVAKGLIRFDVREIPIGR